MKEAAGVANTIMLAVIFFTVITGLVVISVWRYYSRKRLHRRAMLQFDKTVEQTRMELREQTFNTIMYNREGLISALEAEIRNIAKLGVLQPVFRISGKPVMLEENKSLIIFRIVQEALHNALKHAKATLVEMQVHFDCDNVKMTIKDNGKGFLGDGNSAGRGLRTMRDRAKVIGADFNLDSSASQGTLIMLTIPQRSGHDF